MSAKNKRKKKNRETRPRYTAKTADLHELYEKAVQCVEADIDFVERIFKKRFGRKPRLLKEDFCGTAAASAEFVRRSPSNRAIGVDLDAEVLHWGRARHVEPLRGGAERVQLMNANVLDVRDPEADVVLGMNFSYFIFRTRAELLAYFRAVRESLRPEGIAFFDAYGGHDAQVTLEEEHEKDGFTYIWDQHTYNPINSHVVNHIHFAFPDGTEIRKAFTYRWRLWTLREITEALEEVGFSRADVYWEGWDEKNETGDGNFRKRKRAENSAGWIAYIVAEK